MLLSVQLDLWFDVGPQQELSPLFSTLPQETKSYLRSIALVFGQVDKQMLEEIEDDKKRLPKGHPPKPYTSQRGTSRFWEPEANGIADCLRKAPGAFPDSSSPDTDIVSYLSNTSCVTAWTMVQGALLEFQGPGNDSNKLMWDSAISKASLFLELGEKALKSWSPARQTFQPSAAIAAGVEAKLERLLMFNDIYSRKSWWDHQDHHNPPNHRFFLSMAQLRENKEHTIKATNQTQN
ncbi:hypothetical protein LTR93_012028, partial [Exophiala xenobiotica]